MYILLEYLLIIPRSLMNIIPISKKNWNFQKQLSENETHSQLSNLERKLATLEQNNYAMREFVATRAAESDYESVRNDALGLVKELNFTLRENHKKHS